MLVGVTDTAVDGETAKLFPEVKTALSGIGAENTDIGFRMAYCLITRKGSAVTWKKEVLKNRNTGHSICNAVIY